MEDSKVFITGFDSFEIVFVPGTSEIVSRFRGENNLAMKNADSKASLDEES